MNTGSAVAIRPTTAATGGLPRPLTMLAKQLPRNNRQHRHQYQPRQSVIAPR